MNRINNASDEDELFLDEDEIDASAVTSATSALGTATQELAEITGTMFAASSLGP
jgi:hypothetical protein